MEDENKFDNKIQNASIAAYNLNLETFFGRQKKFNNKGGTKKLSILNCKLQWRQRAEGVLPSINFESAKRLNCSLQLKIQNFFGRRKKIP